MPFATTKLSTAARTRVRERLQERSLIPLVESIRGEWGNEHAANIAGLARELSGVIGVDVGYLRPEETLRQSLRVNRDELSDEVGPLFSEIGLQDVVDPFAFALLDLAEKRFREDPSLLQRSAFSPMPANEDEWVERILDLTVARFFEALA